MYNVQNQTAPDILSVRNAWEVELRDHPMCQPKTSAVGVIYRLPSPHTNSHASIINSEVAHTVLPYPIDTLLIGCKG